MKSGAGFERGDYRVDYQLPDPERCDGHERAPEPEHDHRRGVASVRLPDKLEERRYVAERGYALAPGGFAFRPAVGHSVRWNCHILKRNAPSSGRQEGAAHQRYCVEAARWAMVRANAYASSTGRLGN